MYPVLFEILNFQIGTYGLLYAIAFLVGLKVATHFGRREGLEPGRILDLGIYSLLAGIVGAKLFLYLMHFRVYFSNPYEILRTWRAAGVFYGGLLCALAVGILYLRRHRMPLWSTADAAAPAIALGQAIGRLGCFAAGCCYGLPSDRSWAVTFRDPAAHELTGVTLDLPLVPTQLFHSAANLLLFLILVVAWRWKRRPGTIFWLFLLLHGAARLTIESFRNDQPTPIFLAGWSVSQWIALTGVAVGAVMLFRTLRTAAAAPERSR